LSTSPLRVAISAATRLPEPELLPGLIAQATLSASQAQSVEALALRIAGGVRKRARASGRAGLVQGLLQEFALSSQEGVALMCLAEALLRIPDAATRMLHGAFPRACNMQQRACALLGGRESLTGLPRHRSRSVTVLNRDFDARTFETGRGASR